MNFLQRLRFIANHNAGFLLALVILVFGFAIIGFQKDNRRLLEDTAATVKNTETIITNQENDLKTIREELASVKRFNACLLALHDAGEFADGDVQKQCERMSDNVGMNDVTRNPAPSNGSPKATSQGPQSQTNTPPSGQGGNNGGNNQPQIPPRQSILPGDQEPIVGCVDTLGIGVCL